MFQLAIDIILAVRTFSYGYQISPRATHILSDTLRFDSTLAQRKVTLLVPAESVTADTGLWNSPLPVGHITQSGSNICKRMGFSPGILVALKEKLSLRLA